MVRPWASISIPSISIGKANPVDFDWLLSALSKNAVAPIPVLPRPIINDPVRFSRFRISSLFGNDSSCSGVWFDEFSSSFDFLKDNVLLKSLFLIGCYLAFDSGTIDCSSRI